MKVLLDAGHGEDRFNRNDPGAIAFNKHEAEFTEQVAVKAVAILRKTFGVEAFVNRGVHPNALHKKEYNPHNTPKWRIEDAKNIEADLFVSVHWNSSINPMANGTEVLVNRNATRASRLLAETILSHVMGSLTHYVRAKKIKTFVPKNRGVKHPIFSNSLGVLKQNIPCCLLECEFISHPDINYEMENPDYIWTLGYGLAKGIASYLGVTEDADLRHLAQKP